MPKNYPLILAHIESGKWAIKPEALEGILSAVRTGIDPADYELYHKASEAQKEAIVGYAGEPVEGFQDVYIDGNVGVMFVEGPITPRASFFSQVSGMTSVEMLTDNLEVLDKDPHIDAIVQVMDTPGGNVTGISEYTQRVKKASKPVYTYVYGMAASAGYWIASGSKEIHVADTAEVGSIGVVATYTDRTKADKKHGVSRIQIVSSNAPNKRPDLGTNEGRATVQANVDDIEDVFTQAVAENRQVTRDTVNQDFGQGGLLIGAKAVEVGMADKVSTFASLMKSLKKERTPAPGRVFSPGRTTSTNKPKESKNMDQEVKDAIAKMSAGELEALNPDACKELREKGADLERNRIKQIEGLASSQADAPAHVQVAVRTVADAKKFDPTVCAGDLTSDILQAVNEAHRDGPARSAEGARALGVQAGKIATTPAKDKGEELPGGEEEKAAQEKVRVTNMAAGIASGRKLNSI